MTFTYQLADRALEGLRKLECWLQEETLDELDRMAANPDTLIARSRGAAVGDLVRERNGRRHYVFITIIPDARAHHLRIRDIGSCVRSTPTPGN